MAKEACSTAKLLGEVLEAQRLILALLICRLGVDADALAADLEWAADLAIEQHGDEKGGNRHDVRLLRLLAADLRPRQTTKPWQPTVVVGGKN